MTGTARLAPIDYSYDLDNELLSATDSLAASVSFLYNGLGEVIAETQAISGLSSAVTLSSTYNSGGDRTQLSANIGGTVNTTTGAVSGGTDDFVNAYGFDYVDRVTSITQSGVSGGNTVTDKRADFTYFADGQFHTITTRQSLSTSTPDVATSLYDYDSIGRLTGLDQEQVYTSTTFANYSWAYNADDTVASFANASNTGDDFSYSYDSTGQLIGANSTSYSFDANGNLTSGGSTVSSPDSTTGANQISTDGTYNYYYDPVGNITSQVASDGSQTNYGHDNRNRLTSVTTIDSSSRVTQIVAYAYDAFNRLVSRTLTVNTYTGASATPSTTATTTGYFIFDGNSIVLQL